MKWIFIFLSLNKKTIFHLSNRLLNYSSMHRRDKHKKISSATKKNVWRSFLSSRKKLFMKFDIFLIFWILWNEKKVDMKIINDKYLRLHWMVERRLKKNEFMNVFGCIFVPKLKWTGWENYLNFWSQFSVCEFWIFLLFET